MKDYDVVFCVLTYKNHLDLSDFISSLQNYKHINFTYKIVVVNNYADTQSLSLIKEIAVSNDCDFIESENRGYGYGNNLGISLIKETYKYKYLVVCNPDTIVKQFDIEYLNYFSNSIIAPQITCLNGKLQNPMNFSYMPLSERLMYIGFKNNIRLFSLFGMLLIKINRYKNYKIFKKKQKSTQVIHACHGSFIIFSKYALEKLYPVFDENIFLFCEEGDLALKARSLNLDIIYHDEIKILHKEDGSMNQSDFNKGSALRKSYMYYFEKWKIGLK